MAGWYWHGRWRGMVDGVAWQMAWHGRLVLVWHGMAGLALAWQMTWYSSWGLGMVVLV